MAAIYACVVSAAVGAQSRDFATPVWSTSWDYTSISAVRELADGRVLLLDGSEKRLHVLSANGKTIKELGRTGSGPGEFRRPRTLIAMAGDSTAVVDETLRRVQVVRGDLTFGQAASFATMSGMGPGRDSRANSRGQLFFESTEPMEAKTARSALVRWTMGSNRLDTIATLLEPLMSKPAMQGDMLARYFLPYRPADGWTLLSDDRVVVVRANPYTVESLPSGKAPTRLAIQAPLARTVVADKEDWVPQVRDSLPAYKPAFEPESIVAGSDGSVWIKRYAQRGASERIWDVVFPDARRHVVRRLRSEQKVLAVTARGVYIATFDADDLYRLEFHKHPGN